MLNLTRSAVGSPADRLVTLPDELPDLTLGYEAALWAEDNLIQPNGPRAGKPFQLVNSQLRFLLWWYALDDNGQWLFRHGVRRLMKGAGKSPFAAVLALIEFCAPVRLADLDPDRPGGCVGKPVDMPLVQIAATAESQTANTMRMVRAFCSKKSKIAAKYSIDVGKTKFYKLPEGTLEIITSSFTAAEGAESSFVIADETEHWRKANGGIELAATLQDNLAKSGSRMLETSNAWVPGTESVAETSWDAWIAQEEGRTRGTSRILYDARIAPPTTVLSDPDSLRDALEFLIDDQFWQRPEPLMERIWSLNAREDDSKRKYLNWPTADQDSWLAPEDWAQLTDRSRQIADGEEVVLFFDGSLSNDATALIGCCMSDGHVFTVDIWEPDLRRDGWKVPVADVDLAVQLAFETWTVVGFFGDVKEWESFVKLDWPKRYADQLQVKAVPSGKQPEPIAWDMRGHLFEFTQAVELCEAEIKQRAFTHDGDSRLARHVCNMHRRPNRYGVSVGKETPSSARKIDAGVCMIGARMVRRLAVAAGGGKKQRTGTIW